MYVEAWASAPMIFPVNLFAYIQSGSTIDLIELVIDFYLVIVMHNFNVIFVSFKCISIEQTPLFIIIVFTISLFTTRLVRCNLVPLLELALSKFRQVNDFSDDVLLPSESDILS